MKIYQNLSGSWTQIGGDINGDGNSDSSGGQVEISADGTIVAIGASSSNSWTGRVRVYQNKLNTWTLLNSDINGAATENYFGTSIGLSADGNILAVGANRNDDFSTEAGQVKVFSNNLSFSIN